jgi:galactokinase/mevalonate kinase-like predicted kinase
MLKAGEVFVKKFEKLSESEREAFEKSIDPVKWKETADRLRQLSDDFKSGRLFPQYDTPNFVGGASVSVIDVLLELVETIRRASEQSDAIAREANGIAKKANWYSSLAIIAAVVCALISLPSLPSSIASWLSYFCW